MRGIILAGGAGTRLYPLTRVISKQLLPVYDKPVIYYPLSVLMLAGIREILIISTPVDIPKIESLFGNGESLGLSIQYAVQDKPQGIAQAFIIGEKFIRNEPVCLILGDNFFYGHNLSEMMARCGQITNGATVVAYHVNNPEAYGVVEVDVQNKPLSLVEKPKNPKSKWAVTGLYFYDGNVVNMAKQLKPSARHEYEITDLNRLYLEKNLLNVEFMGRGFAWLDMGTPDTLLQSAQFVQTIEKRQGLKIACIEEMAYLHKFIDEKRFRQVIADCLNPDYKKYLQNILDQSLQPGPHL